YELLCRNYRIRQGEVDLIVKKDNIIVFVEVKTRNKDWNLSVPPRVSVNYNKQQKIKMVARHFLATYQKLLDIRFDVIEIFKEGEFYKYRHFPGAF
ncbi:MAG: YraN family protein, partial [Halanaerobiales bacterium]